MKKTFWVGLVVAASLLAGCSFDPGSILSGLGGGGSASSTSHATDEVSITEEPIPYGEDYVASHLGDYYLTYSYVTKDQGVASAPVLITSARNATGYYYKDTEGSEVLFLKNGEKYDLYTRTSPEEGWVVVPEVQWTKEEAEGYVTWNLNYMTIYGVALNDMEADGEETIASRLCAKYVFHSSFQTSRVDIRYSVDKLTGVCLRYATSVVSGTDTGAFEFVATVFQTERVTLPSPQQG